MAKRSCQLLGEVVFHFYLFIVEVVRNVIDYKDLEKFIFYLQAFDLYLQESSLWQLRLCIIAGIVIFFFEEIRRSLEVALIIL